MANFPDLEHYKGNTFEEVLFQYKLNGVSVDITNFIIKMQLRKEHEGVVYLELTSVASNGITISNGTDGMFKINKQVIDIKAGNYIYDIEFNDNGVIDTYIKGNFNIVNDVTYG